MKYTLPILITCGFLFAWDKAFSVEIDTGNLLNNSTFGTGSTTTTTGWSTSGNDGIHTHGAWNGFPYQTGMDDTGGVLAFEGHEEDNVYQDVDLVGDGHLTQSEINQGFTSTMGADVWFWNNIENTLTLKQTITGADGSVSTQVREITDSTTGVGTFTNYTNVYTQGSNTQTDITIRAELFNETAGTAYDNSHRGPDVDNVQLNVTYTYIPPIDADTQGIIDDIDTDIVDIIQDIPEDFDWYSDEIVFEEEYTFEEEEYTWEDDYVIEDDFYFEEEYTMEEDMYFEEFEMEELDMTAFEQPPMFEDFEELPEMDFEEMPSIEEVFFEDEYVMEPPPMMMEEVFTEEFEEDFTDFLEETGMEEEFMEFLEDEGITAEEFFEEITEEEFNDELTEESFEEFEEPMEEIATNEESVPEVIEDEKETMEEPTASESEPIEEEPTEVAKNEPTDEPQQESKEEEPSSEGTEESEVQPEDSGEEDGVQPEDGEKVDTKDGVITDVAKVESKLKKNLKAIAKQIAQVTKENTQNLTKEDLFFKGNDLDAYKQVAFYTAKEVYENTNMGLFLQIDLSPYTGDIYVGANLNAYKEDDPIEINRVKLINITTVKNKLLAELEALRR